VPFRCQPGAREAVGVTDARGVPPPAGTPVLLCPVDELTGDDGLASGCGVGLAGAELDGVVVGLPDVLISGDFVGVFDADAVHVPSAG
jgi:hypothetical protein